MREYFLKCLAQCLAQNGTLIIVNLISLSDYKLEKAIRTKEVIKSTTNISKATFTSEIHTLLEGSDPTHLETKQKIVPIHFTENLSGV